jgi:plastocyanin
MRPLLAVIAIGLAASAAVPGAVPRAAGIIRGTVIVPALPAADRPIVSALAGHGHAPPDPRRAVVFLEEGPPRGAFEELRPGRVRMDQRGQQFVPRVLAITVGTVVEFPNSDTTFHNVFSLSRVRTFDLGRYRPGRTGAVRFDRPGIVPIFCDIHAHMSAYVLVFTHPFFAVTDADGRYAIQNVPAGTYTVMVWSEMGRTASRGILVADGGTAEVDFRVGRAQ